MAFAFEIPVGGSRSEAIAFATLHLTAFCGAAVFSWSLRELSWILATFSLLGLTLAVSWSARRAAARRISGWLAVDDRGLAYWSAAHPARTTLADPGDCAFAGSSHHLSAPRRAVEPRVWGRIGQLAWIMLRVEGKRVILLSGADRCRDDQWRALCAWLRWLDRAGGARQENLGNSDTRPKLP